MKKFAIATGTLLAVATSAPFISTGTAYADTTSETSHQTQAGQTLLQQIESLQRQIDKEHDAYLKNQLRKALETYHDDLAKDQSARGELKATIHAYEQAVKQDKGHDDGTIVRTLGQVNHVLAAVKDALKDNMRPEQADIREMQRDIQKHQLQQAINDVHKADARVKNETGALKKASLVFTQIVKEIVNAADTAGSSAGAGSDTGGTGSTSGTDSTGSTSGTGNSTDTGSADTTVSATN